MTDMTDKGQQPMDADDDAFELDLESTDAVAEVEDVMQDALDAVEKRRAQKAEQSGEHDALDEPADGGASQGDSARLKEQLLRTLADFDNYRKRTDREKASLRSLAISDVLKEMLPVIDNLERATAASGTIEELKGGLEMVLRQQADVLRRFHVTQVAAVGEPFDPAVHEAVAREDSSEIAVPTVVRELQKGYKIGDRLLRPAMVHVAMPVPGSDGG